MKSFVSLLLLLPFADALGSAFCGRIANTNSGSIGLSCQDTGAVIASIDFASYGTPTGACGSFKSGACESKTSMSVVNGTCFNKASCKIVRLNCRLYHIKLVNSRTLLPCGVSQVPWTNVFGDPCAGTYKYLDIQARCTSGTGTAINSGPTPPPPGPAPAPGPDPGSKTCVSVSSGSPAICLLQLGPLLLGISLLLGGCTGSTPFVCGDVSRCCPGKALSHECHDGLVHGCECIYEPTPAPVPAPGPCTQVSSGTDMRPMQCCAHLTSLCVPLQAHVVAQRRLFVLMYRDAALAARLFERIATLPSCLDASARTPPGLMADKTHKLRARTEVNILFV
jgi:hypothetical protein